jgi:hypothetical protein
MGSPAPRVEVEVGQVWRVRKTGERWRVLVVPYDGPGTVRMGLLNDDGELDDFARDSVWFAELFAGCDLDGGES